MLLSILRSNCCRLGRGWTSPSTSTRWSWAANWTRRGRCGGQCLRLCIWELTQLCRCCKIHDCPHCVGSPVAPSLVYVVKQHEVDSSSLLWVHGAGAESLLKGRPRWPSLGKFSIGSLMSGSISSLCRRCRPAWWSPTSCRHVATMVDRLSLGRDGVSLSLLFERWRTWQNETGMWHEPAFFMGIE